MTFPLLIFSPNPQFLNFSPAAFFPWIMKCHVNMQLSTKVCAIYYQKNHSPSFPFLLFHFVPHCLSFHFFPQHHPPLAIIFCKIYTPLETAFVQGDQEKLRFFYNSLQPLQLIILQGHHAVVASLDDLQA